jgi:ATP-dependent Clp protease ATP-binding subunit ClpA
MKMLEDTFSNVKKTNQAGAEKWQNPFAQNKPQEKKESKTPALDFFGQDLTVRARDGKIDPVIGRESEISRLISILNRKTKNNPCLVGDPGVGKTAVVEWLARRIALGEVPFAMRDKRIIALDLSMMVAGTKYRGEFEWRLKQVIDEAAVVENEVVLFIDEIHTIIGAWGAEGTLDAANILKPAMGAGQICLIGATTLNEYQKYIEKDSALERRFQKVDVPEPDFDTSLEVISGLRTTFEEFHNLIIDDDAIEDAVVLSTRYITDRFLPDKAIDLIDEACSEKSMTYSVDTSEVEEIKERIATLQKDIESLLISQQYQKALVKRREMDQLKTEADEKRKKRVIPSQKSSPYHFGWCTACDPPDDRSPTQKSRKGRSLKTPCTWWNFEKTCDRPRWRYRLYRLFTEALSSGYLISKSPRSDHFSSLVQPESGKLSSWRCSQKSFSQIRKRSSRSTWVNIRISRVPQNSSVRLLGISAMRNEECSRRKCAENPTR